MSIALVASLAITMLALGLRQTIQEEIVGLGCVTVALVGAFLSLILAPLWLQAGILLLPFFISRLTPLRQ